MFKRRNVAEWFVLHSGAQNYSSESWQLQTKNRE
jgi:hypothetical protein